MEQSVNTFYTLKNFKSSLLKRDNLPFSFSSDLERENHLKKLQIENLDFLLFLQIDSYERANAPFKNLKRNYNYEIGLRQLQLKEISTVISSFQQIPVAFLKGILLPYWLHLPLYKRSVDIDILIEKKHINKAAKILIDLGYQHVPTKSNGEMSFKNSAGIFLDLHYDLTASSPFIYLSNFDIESILKKQLIHVDIDGVKIPTFNVNMTFLHLCIHFTVNHQLNNFILIYELTSFIKIHFKDLDWSFINDFCMRHGLTVIVGMNLYLMNNLSDSKMHPISINEFIHSDKDKNTIQNFLTQFDIQNQLVKGQKNLVEEKHIIALVNNRNKFLLKLKGHIYWIFNIYQWKFKF